MTRNTTRRVEVAAPVRDPDLCARLEQVFQDQLRDTAKGRVQQPDGAYIRAQGELFNSQEWFCDQAYCGAWARPALQKPAPAPQGAAKPEKRPAAAPKRPAARPLPAKKPPAPQKQPAVKVRVRPAGLLGRLFRRG